MGYTGHGILQARILEWVAFPFSRGIFPTQGLNPGLPHCRRILYQLSHKGSQHSTQISPASLIFLLQAQKYERGSLLPFSLPKWHPPFVHNLGSPKQEKE